MNDQKLKRRVTPSAEREALKVFGLIKIEKAVSEQEKAQKAFHERLKALRLAREAAREASDICNYVTISRQHQWRTVVGWQSPAESAHGLRGRDRNIQRCFQRHSIIRWYVDGLSRRIGRQ
jgi:hypothetical protein